MEERICSKDKEGKGRNEPLEEGLKEETDSQTAPWPEQTPASY